MKTGLKSLLVGYHAWWLHPFFVAEAWRRLYGFPFDPRLWLAFFVHDLGYYECEHIDDAKGTLHPFFGAAIAHLLCDAVGDAKWHCFVLYHSRTIAKGFSAPLSELGYADKLAFLLYPKWLLRVLYFFSGELIEYMKNCEVSTWEEWYSAAVEHNKKTLSKLDSSHTSVL